MLTVNLPLKDPKKPPALKFPERCVNCGQPKAKEYKLSLDTGAQKRGQLVQMEFAAPLCAACAKKEDRITNVTLVPFTVVGLIVFTLAFIPAWAISPEGTTPDTAGSSLVFGAFLALVAGIIVGTLAEILLKFLLAPAYGTSLLRRPLTIFSFLSNSENVLGLSARFQIEKKNLQLIFENEEVAREFNQMNLQESS
jgi:hypothetical protein